MKRFITVFIFTIFSLNLAIAGTTGRLTGRVIDAELGKVLAGVKVMIVGTEFNSVTDSKGLYLIRDIPPGKYMIKAAKSGFRSSEMADVYIKVDITTSMNIELRRDPADADFVIVSGKVCDAGTNKPIEGARVIIVDEGIGAETDKDGNFKLPIIKAKVYSIKVDAEGYIMGWYHDQILSPGPEKKLTLVLYKRDKLETKSYTTKFRPIMLEIAGLIKAELSSIGRIETGSPNSVTVTDTKDRLKKIDEIVEKYDVPFKQIWLEVNLILASSDEKSNNTLPKELDAVSKHLKSLFKYKSYEILDNARIMAYEDKGCYILIGKGDYAVMVDKIDVLNVNGGLIKLQKLILSRNKQDILATTVNIPNGDTVILGASNVDLGGKALITAVTAKILE